MKELLSAAIFTFGISAVSFLVWYRRRKVSTPTRSIDTKKA